MVHVDDGRFPHIGSGQISNVSDQFDGLFALPFRRARSRGSATRNSGYPHFGRKRRITYKTDEVFTRTLSCSTITGIVFETTDIYDYSQQIQIDIIEAVDDAGIPENAAALFDPFYEWNAMSY